MLEVSTAVYFLYFSAFIHRSCKRQKRPSVSQSFRVTLSNMNGYVYRLYFLGHTASKYFFWGKGVSLFPNLSQPAVCVCRDNQHRIHYCKKKRNIFVRLTKRINSRVITLLTQMNLFLFLYFCDICPW